MDEYKEIKREMRMVYLHDQRPWMIGFSGGKDSTLLCQLVFEMLEELPEKQRWKKVYVVTSDTLVENPIVKTYMHRMSRAINEASKQKKLNVERELENALEGMYQKHVPANVREFIEMRSQVEKPQKKKVQRGERAMLSLAEDMIK